MARTPHPPLPIDEAARLRTLRALGVLDSPPDAVLDGLVRSAARVLGCPIALLSLVDADRQRVKACFGIEAFETPREAAFCAHTICGDGPFEVPDAACDPRFASSPLVAGPPGVRFYAGMPLQVEGRRRRAVRAGPRAAPAGPSTTRRACRPGPAPPSCACATSARISNCGRRGLRQPTVRADRRRRAAARRQPPDRRCERRGAVDARPPPRHAVRPRPARVDRRAHDHARLSPWTTDEAEGAAPARGRTRLPAPRRATCPVEASLRRLDAAPGAGPARLARAPRPGAAAEAAVAGGRAMPKASSSPMQPSASSTSTPRRWPRRLHARRGDGRDARAVLGGGKRRYQRMLDLLHKGKAAKGLLQSRHKNGTLVDEFAVVTPIRDARGRITHYLAVKEDVTEKRRMGAELDRYRHHLEELVEQRTAELELAKKAAEAANKAKSAFLAMMSHEIRTPMNGVVGTVDVLRQSTLTPYQTELTDTIRDSASALLALIDDILDCSKIEAGRMTLEVRPITPQEGIEQTCEGLLAAAQACQVRLHCFVDPRLPRRMLGDPLRLRQLLNNIAGNAIKSSAGLAARAGCASAPRPTPTAACACASRTTASACRTRCRRASSGPSCRPTARPHAPLRRHRSRAVDLRPAGRDVRRPHRGRQRAPAAVRRSPSGSPLPTVADDEDAPWTEARTWADWPAIWYWTTRPRRPTGGLPRAAGASAQACLRPTRCPPAGRRRGRDRDVRRRRQRRCRLAGRAARERATGRAPARRPRDRPCPAARRRAAPAVAAAGRGHGGARLPRADRLPGACRACAGTGRHACSGCSWLRTTTSTARSSNDSSRCSHRGRHRRRRDGGVRALAQRAPRSAAHRPAHAGHRRLRAGRAHPPRGGPDTPPADPSR